jgi:hypothetical protein
MYGIDEVTWERMWKNRDFHECFKPNEQGHAQARKRKKHFEKQGYEVIPYDDVGVSVGIYVLKKEKDDAECSDKAGDIPS